MLMAFFSWWYGSGWQRQVLRVSEQMSRLFDLFSFSLLTRTLFSPFRQISAESVNGSLAVQLRAWGDQLVSRFIGALVRIATLIGGSIMICLMLLFAIIRIVLWPILPILPLIVFVMWSGGLLSWK